MTHHHERRSISSGSPYETPIGFSRAVRIGDRVLVAADWEPVGRAHGRHFDAVRPAAKMVVVSRLLDARWKVEMEAEAVIGSGAMVDRETGSR